MSVSESILDHAISATLDREMIDRHCSEQRVEVSDFLNQVSLEIARRFDRREMCYDDADRAMNSIWVFVVDLIVADKELLEPAYSVYDAFDQGEFDHGDGQDPVAAHTRRLVKEILAEA